MKQLSVMKTIQHEKAKEIKTEAPPELDEEGRKLAEAKRESFDIPISAVQIDPLR